MAGGGAAGLISKTGDDVVSKSGYGERALVTPTAVVALNNDDNIIAYADDMISDMAGVKTLSKGKIASDTKQQSVSVDISGLERKLDQVIKAIGTMDVVMDGNKVGKVIVNSDQKASVAGIFRSQRL
jgi:hypothetical protein